MAVGRQNEILFRFFSHNIKPETTIMSDFNESEVQVFTLKNEHGMEAKFINYGAILVSLRVPDRNGQVGEVTLGK